MAGCQPRPIKSQGDIREGNALAITMVLRGLTELSYEVSSASITVLGYCRYTDPQNMWGLLIKGVDLYRLSDSEAAVASIHFKLL